MAGERRAVLDSESTVLLHARQVQQHREAGGPFDEGADGGAFKADNEVALPVAGSGSIVGFGWPLADKDFVADEAPWRVNGCALLERGVRDRCAGKR